MIAALAAEVSISMREISPLGMISADAVLQFEPTSIREKVSRIRNEKENCVRRMPSSTLVDRSTLLTRNQRAWILDAVAKLVDENLFGRCEMCIQFADLLQRALAHLGLPARAVAGTAIYYADNREIFRWAHAWVRVGAEVIDGNVDSTIEHRRVPAAVSVTPYWGPSLRFPRAEGFGRTTERYFLRITTYPKFGGPNS
jgi:hypothetical protein